MTEAEWLSCADPVPMLKALAGTRSARKKWLFVCACCRRTWHLLTPKRGRKKVELAERYADGLIGSKEFMTADLEIPLPYEHARIGATVGTWYALRAAVSLRDFHVSARRASWVDMTLYAAWAAGAAAATADLGWDDAAWDKALRNAWVRVGYDPLDGDDWDDVRTSDAVWEMGWDSFTSFPGWVSERRKQAELVRDVFGPRTKRRVAIDRAWLAWNDATVVKLAQAIYGERGFDRLPILADALEEAGCDNHAILSHCRDDGEHALGCWVVDAVLGKK
jgi:hypothetical protein